MFEDTVLALVVKNYMQYDYVVGNPPYVRVQNLPEGQKAMMERLYETTTGNYDIYCPFYERGLEWLVDDSGKLGFITPNQFMVTDYGEGLRRVLLQKSLIKEVYDFRDSGVFEDATNYPAIVIAEVTSEKERRDRNAMRCVRVKSNSEENGDPQLDEAIIKNVQMQRDNPGYNDDYIDVFDFPQKQLDDEYWSLMPPEEFKIIKKLENQSSQTVGNITESVFAGTQTSANNIFVVTVAEVEKIRPNDTGKIVRIVPKGQEREYRIETDLLRPWFKGRDVERWRGDWSGQHIIMPYSVQRDPEGNITTEILDSDFLKSNLPLTWQYLLGHKEELESREGGRFRGKNNWYDFGYPKSMDRFENPKLMCPAIAAEATFMLDERGEWYFKSAYGIQLKKEYMGKTNLIAGLFNSKVLDFYLKHYTSLKMGGYYVYSTNYLSPVPIIIPSVRLESQIVGIINDIGSILDLQNQIDRFPETYIHKYDGQLDYITYEWQTRRYPISADVQGDVDGEFTVQAGRTDNINDPAMYSDDHGARKKRAEYVCTAVNGRSVKSGEEMTIPIPQSDEGVEELLHQLDDHKRDVERTDVDGLEAEIDELVYDLFGLTDDEREVIEDYLEVF
jgi:hypothetical protein